MISANGGVGVQIENNVVATASGNLVQGNFIGTNAAGSAALGNAQGGVQFLGALDDTLGGSTAAARNVISGNMNNGVFLDSSSSSITIAGNLIGTDVTGTTALANDGTGVSIIDSSGNTIGGTTSGAQNVISGNSVGGVLVQSDSSGTATNNLIAGNFIGTDRTGTVALGNATGFSGVNIYSPGNTVGGTTAGARNVISGNNNDGVFIQRPAATGNLVAGNFIGTDVTGTKALGNGFSGVQILDASGNTIGGTTTAARNVISGNTADGVFLTSDGTAPASSNLVEGNYIGTDLTGTVALGNGTDGVGLDDAVSNTIGGPGGAANLISGNLGRGVDIFTGSNTNTVQGNLIGTSASGTNALGNTIEGVAIDGSTGNLIGGTAAGTGNLISGNLGRGVDIFSAATGTIVEGNDIGTKLGGTGALGNHGDGVALFSNGNTVGGTSLAARNIIAANNGNGVLINSSGSLIEGNSIGIDATGTSALGNTGDGVLVGGSSNTIGGTTTGASNLISANTGNGVEIPAGASNNEVAGNSIGTDASGTIALGNLLDGVAISGAGATGNTVGGTTAGSVNLISGNLGAGVDIFAQATGNLVAGNFIGTDITGTLTLGNSLSGVVINDASGNTVGGTTSGSRNLISANIESGVLIESDGLQPAANNLIEGNDIGTDISGNHALGNEIAGVFIQSASSNTIGSTVAGGNNLISGNIQGGVRIVGTATLPAASNQVLGNSIGPDATGKAALGNGPDGDGVLLQDAVGNTVGGTASGAGNLISGNLAAGVSIVTLEGPAPTNNVIAGNRIGTDSTGTSKLGNAIGVSIAAGSSNTVGGTATAAQNVISGNTAQGVNIAGNSSISTANNLVAGNLIGTDATGGVAVGNLGGGVAIMDSSGNTVGGTATGAGNVISGNSGDGVKVTSDGTTPAAGNLIAGNFIGTDKTGTLALGNTSNGVELNTASSNTVGGTALGARNVISANGGDGVLVRDTGASSNVISGNYIGTDVTGMVGVDTNGKSLGNTDNGVGLFHASSTTVGGTATGSGNVLSNNGQSGVAFGPDSSGDNNVVEGNLIGTDSTGAKALGNTGNGINIANTLSDTIGGTTAAARNVISGNHREGIFIGFAGSATTPALDVVLGNYIGPDVTGLKAIGNGLSGVTLENAVGITIGGTATGAGNLISGNGPGNQPGISIAGSSQDNLVEGNLIGTDKTGLAPIGGSSSQSNNLGIVLNDNGGETIGGTAPGAGNTIAFNADTGILVFTSSDNPASGTAIAGNTIHANGGDGIKLQSAAGQVLGTGIQMNVITDNTLNGVWVDGPSNTSISDNTISGNMNDGVKVTQGTGNSILTNSIFNNTNLAIELTSGGNNSQPSPVLTSATLSNNGTTIVGTLQAAANTLYHLQFFSSPTSTPPGFGEAETFLGEVLNVSTDGSGMANINATLSRRRRGQPVPDGNRNQPGHQRHLAGLEDQPQPLRDSDRHARAGEPDPEPDLHDHPRQQRRLADHRDHDHRHAPQRRHVHLGHRRRHPRGQRGDLPGRGPEPRRQHDLHHRRPRRYAGHDHEHGHGHVHQRER